jgi:uncharacterized protein YbjT (DUF2867 family)
VVYLSGLHPPHGPLSEHLASRLEVGQLLLGSEVPTAVLQAAVVVGAGSASFELLRHLGRLLPVVPSAGWLDTRVQPIAVGDLLAYLTGAADLPPGISRTFDVGGPEVLTYREMLARFAALAGRPRPVTVPVPGLTPALAGPWAGRLTPVPEGLVRALVGSLPHVESVTLEVADETALHRRAREAAFADARQRAELYASLAGRTLGAVHLVSEVLAAEGPGPRFAMAAGDAGLPVQPGAHEVTARLRVTWALD